MSDEAPKVEDQPCPKCGGTDVTLMWCEEDIVTAGEHQRCRDLVPQFYKDEWRTSALREHFHRTCQRCRYWWPTVDVLS